MSFEKHIMYEDREYLTAAQPAPQSNTSTPIWELVVADMRERDHVEASNRGA